jgi:hypothetical protein
MTTIVLTNNSANFRTCLSPFIRLDRNKNYEAALLSIDLYNSIPNVTEKNNKFQYSTDEGRTWKTITLPTGSYEVAQIETEIQKQMIINDDYNKSNNEFYINIIPNVSELKSVIEITNDKYRVKLDNDDAGQSNSILKTLGFQAQPNNVLILSSGSNQSQNIVNITNINSVLVNVDLTSGSYVNSNQSSAIYSFDPNRVPPGFKLNERPNPIIYYPIHRSVIDSISVWLTDQDNNSIDIRGEKITIRLVIREVENIEESIVRAIKKLKEENIL